MLNRAEQLAEVTVAGISGADALHTYAWNWGGTGTLSSSKDVRVVDGVIKAGLPPMSLMAFTTRKFDPSVKQRVP